MEAQLLKPTVDEDDVYESSDDEELEERIMHQQVLEEFVSNFSCLNV